MARTMSSEQHDRKRQPAEEHNTLQTRRQNTADGSNGEEERGRRKSSVESCQLAQTSRREQQPRKQGDTMKRQGTTASTTTKVGHDCNFSASIVTGAATNMAMASEETMVTRPSRVDEMCREAKNVSLLEHWTGLPPHPTGMLGQRVWRLQPLMGLGRYWWQQALASTTATDKHLTVESR